MPLCPQRRGRRRWERTGTVPACAVRSATKPWPLGATPSTRESRTAISLATPLSSGLAVSIVLLYTEECRAANNKSGSRRDTPTAGVSGSVGQNVVGRTRDQWAHVTDVWSQTGRQGSVWNLLNCQHCLFYVCTYVQLKRLYASTCFAHLHMANAYNKLII
jgi:hypothetical protein